MTNSVTFEGTDVEVRQHLNTLAAALPILAQQRRTDSIMSMALVLPIERLN
jgi:hypothetical protein